MLTHTTQLLIIVLIAILLPSAFSFPFSIYDMKNYRRASRAGGSSSSSSNQAFSAPLQRQRYDQSSYLSPSSSYFANYDTTYDSDSDADNYYVDDDSDDRPEREYLYGKPTYHGEYKPSRYYYARAPNYNYYNDHAESTNPLDDLHEEMLQEDHNRQRNWPSGQPKSLTGNFMKNLMMDTQPMDTNNAYDDDDDDDGDDVKTPYFNDLSNQNEPYDYFDPLKLQAQQFNHYDQSQVNKPTYYNHENRKDDEYRMSNKNVKQTHGKDDFLADKEEKDLESLRINQQNQKYTWDNNDNEFDKQTFNDAASPLDKSKHDDTYNVGYDSGFDYDDDEWINWNRKRSPPNKPLRPLKALEYELTKALQEQRDASKVSSTTMPPTISTTSSATSKTHEHKGQKEVVLSRPATPIRRHFPDNVFEALTKTANEMKQSNQEDTSKQDAKTDDNQQPLQHSLGTKKHKRYVSSETSLVQQLNGLKQKIRA